MVRIASTLHLDPSRVYAGYREMAEREARRPAGERLDFVSIVVTTSHHYEVARCFVEHGFNVVCDKPMTTSLEDARTLRDLVRKAGTAFVLTHNYTGYPMVKEARHRIAAGELGRVNKVVVEYPQGWLSQLVEGGASGINMWRMDPSQAGPSNCTGDIGIHAENLCRYVTGLEIEELCAEVGVSRMVYSSSAAVYGTPAVNPIPESAPFSPQSPYGETKVVGEWLAAHGGVEEHSARAVAERER